MLRLVKNHENTVFVVLCFLAFLGVLGIIIFPTYLKSVYFSGVAVIFLIALASFATGSLIGFLFGIPRTLQKDSETDKTQYLQNTNLEQISDWLTKILVGLGLSQLNHIGQQINSISIVTSKGIDGSEKAAVFMSAVIVYYLILGFLILYLWARLNLIRAFKIADLDLEVDTITEMIVELEGSEDDPKKSNSEIIKKLNGKLYSILKSQSDIKNRLNELARKYERIRIEQIAGKERTLQLSKLMAEVRAIAASTSLNPLYYYNMNSTGYRIIALGILREYPDNQYLDLIMDCIENSKSAFEQYHALKVTLLVMPQLTDEKKTIVKNILKYQMSEDLSAHINPQNSDRWNLSHRILDM